MHAPNNLCIEVEDGEGEKQCLHKPLTPILPSEYFGYFAIATVIGIANIGGIAGGVIFVPICTVLFYFPTKEAIPLSTFSLFCTTLVRFVFFSSNSKNPEKDTTIIDYSIVQIMFPTVLIGSYIGVGLNIILSDVAMSAFMFIFLCYLSYRSFKKVFNMVKAENKEKA